LKSALAVLVLCTIGIIGIFALALFIALAQQM
jgi:hypothetical protein